MRLKCDALKTKGESCVMNRKFLLIIIFGLMVVCTFLTTEKADATTLPTPIISSLSSEDCAVDLRWDNVESGMTIEIWNITDDKVFHVASQAYRYVFQNLAPGKTLKIQIRAFDGSNYSNWSSTKSVVVKDKITKYTISYDANGGSGAPSSQTKEEGKTIKLRTTKPTKAGYTFVGWSTNRYNDTAEYKAGASFNNDNNTILYAIWKKTYNNISSVSVNTWTPLQHKEPNRSIKISFTLDEAGWIEPEMWIDDEEDNHLLWDGCVTDADLQNKYSVGEENEEYEDYDGHKWRIEKYEKMRLPEGNYCFYVNEAEGSQLTSYGYFKVRINFESEEYEDDVEKEFNDSRSTANIISLNKMYWGSIGANKEDVDYFRFSINEKSKVVINVFFSENENYAWNSCELIKNNGNALADGDFTKDVEDSNGIVWKKYKVRGTLRNGTYYIKISGLNRSNDYRFKVRKK